VQLLMYIECGGVSCAMPAAGPLLTYGVLVRKMVRELDASAH
jgi:hypothetical protein